jgi:hypothetical protein
MSTQPTPPTPPAPFTAQRKRERAFTGLAGSPLAQTREKRKRGRPPKNARAMTGAERVRDLRNRQKIDKALEEDPINMGRLPNEESGGFGPNEIVAVAESVVLGNVAREGDAELGGKPVRPAGPGDADETDASGEPQSERLFVNRQKWSLNWRLSPEEIRGLILDLANSKFTGEPAHSEYIRGWDAPGWVEHPSTLACSICGQPVKTWEDAAEHLHRYLGKGWSRKDHHYKLVRDYIKALQPKRVSRPRGCPPSFHKQLAEQRHQKGDRDIFICGDCGRTVYPDRC